MPGFIPNPGDVLEFELEKGKWDSSVMGKKLESS